MSSARRLSIAIGLIVAILSVAAIMGASIALKGAWQTATVTVLSVILSIGLISLAYEIWLRDAVAGELLAMVRPRPVKWCMKPSAPASSISLS